MSRRIERGSDGVSGSASLRRLRDVDCNSCLTNVTQGNIEVALIPCEIDYNVFKRSDDWKNKDKNCNHPFFCPRVYSVYTKASWDRPVTGTKLTLNVYYQWWIEFVERSTICYRRDLDQGFFLDGYNSRVSESSATSIFVPSSPYWYQRLELCRVKRSWPLSGWGFINIEWTRNENSTRNRLKAIENL